MGLLQSALFSTTQSQYGAIDPAVPIVSEGEKMGIESAKVRVQNCCVIFGSKSALGAGVNLPGAIRAEGVVA